MKRWVLLLVITVYLSACRNTEKEMTKSEGKILTREEMRKIFNAVPEEPSVTPSKTRKLLVFSLAWGYKHDAIAWGKEVFEIMAQKTGAFEAVVSDDVAMFEPENLHQFDGILFNNTNNEIFLPENYDALSPQDQAEAREKDGALKESFTHFLAGGKGLAVIHAGVASFREWPEYGEIIGARFDNHPWSAGSTVTLRVEEPDHPLVQSFPDKTFEVTDEIYQMKGLYSRDKLRVLISIDTCRTHMEVEDVHRMDGDFAISWIKRYGKGRVFYCALGHQKHVFWDPVVLGHFLNGLQFVLGDLECDTTPSGKIQRVRNERFGENQ